MSKKKLGVSRPLLRQLVMAATALVMSTAVSATLANHFMPLFWERSLANQLLFFLAAMSTQSVGYYLAIRGITWRYVGGLSRNARYLILCFSVLMGIALVVLSALWTSNSPHITLEILASGGNFTKSTYVQIVEIRDPEGKKVPYFKMDLRGWEDAGGMLVARARGASLRYTFDAPAGDRIAILFAATPSSAGVSIRINGAEVPIDFHIDGYSQNWQVVTIPSEPGPSRPSIRSVSLAGADAISTGFIVILLLSLIGTFLVRPSKNLEQRAHVLLVFLGICYLVVFYLNNLSALVDTQTWEFRFPQVVPVIPPVGDDFRTGVYRPARVWLSNLGMDLGSLHRSDYPPFLSVLFSPYLIFGEDQAYLVHTAVLLIANVVALALVAAIARRCLAPYSGLNSATVNIILLGLFGLVLFNLLTSYPFLFSVERGNSDIVALAFCLWSLWVIVKSPDRVWLQALLLSIAVHIKVYPGFLFALLFYKDRLRAILPLTVINLILLAVAGPTTAVMYIGHLIRYAEHPFVWLGNHSGYSFAKIIASLIPGSSEHLPMMRSLFTFLPVVLWLAAATMLAARKYCARNAILGFMITVPLMEVFPSVSHDYKLVILSAATLLLMCLILLRQSITGLWIEIVQLLVIAVVTLIVGRSFALTDSRFMIVQNKYIWVVLLQIMMLMGVFQSLRSGEEPPAGPLGEFVVSRRESRPRRQTR